MREGCRWERANTHLPSMKLDGGARGGLRSERMRTLATILLTAAAVAPAPSLSAPQGPRISLNGIAIDGVTNQRFENCNVTIDGHGNVNIEARGYAVRHGQPGTAGADAPLQAVPLAAVPPPAAAPPAPPPTAPAANAAPEKLTRRYFLATEQSRVDGTQFDIAVFVNAKWIRELKSSEDQVVTEVTKYLRPGVNNVVLAATKRISGERKSTSKDVAFRVIIGEGNAGGDHVMIDNPLVEMKRTAAETEDVTEAFTFVAR